MPSAIRRFMAPLGLALIAAPLASQADEASVKQIVDQAVTPVMSQYQIPGMAVAVTVDGKSYLFNYGVASKDTRKPVSADTLFELGSISKTFTVTLASYAQVTGKLAWTDPVRQYLPELKGSAFGDVPLFHLATHTAGGFPLQFPDDVKNNAQLIDYLKNWTPIYPVGTYRTYANPSIGTLGMIAAKSLNGDFTTLMEKTLFPALGLNSTFIDVPQNQMARYAQGYNKEQQPVRLNSGILGAEAYGVKSTSRDLIRFVEANMGQLKLDAPLQQALNATHTGYFTLGDMTQDMIWEDYRYPVALKTLLAGNALSVIYDANPVKALSPPRPPREDVWINKTGSTGGFGGYLAYVPQQRLGIVLLANSNYPNEVRASVAHAVFSALAAGKP